jgi:predicted molibdopterin-dependent oxidoreductase YjgC
MISLTINGKTLEVSEYITVLQAAEQAGITIPTLCYHKDLTPYGGCRLCVVEVLGSRLPVTSCTTPVSRGMVVQTETPTLIRYRRSILELLLSNYYDAGYTRSDGKAGVALDTQFAHWVEHYGIDLKSAMAKAPHTRVDSDPNPFVWVDKNKCILCTRCVRACAEIQGRFIWAQAYRGNLTQIVAGADSTMLQSRCESCGACVAYCPTGALDNKMSVSLGHPDHVVTTTCSYCSVGCQFDLNTKGERILRVTSNPKAPFNGMHLCVKGRYGYDFIQSANRLNKPRVRKYLLEGMPRPKNLGSWVEVDWDTALKVAADSLKSARQQFGPQKIGFLASGKCLNEENYLMNKFARQVIGTNNIDCCSHLVRASTVDGLDVSLGLHAMPTTFDEVTTHARSMLVIGSNTTEQHPVFGIRLRQAVLRRGLKMVVAHPDFINMSEYAALRLVHKPGTDLALVNGLMYILLEKGWENREFIERHTLGFEDFRRSLKEYSPEQVSSLTGVPVETLYHAVEILAHNHPVSVIWGPDLTHLELGQHVIQGLVNLELLLGDLGVSGGGVIPLRSQNNSQGAGDMGALPGYLSGYQPVKASDARQKFAAAWGVELPDTEGLSASQMIAAADDGSLKVLYILGEDILPASPDSVRVRHALQKCDLVILQGVFASETSHYADVLLPGVTFAEKTGTFTNSERRIQMVHQAIPPQGEARTDWLILAELADRTLNGGHVKTAEYSGWQYNDTAQVMTEIAALTPIYNGVSHDRLEQVDRLQWPVEGPGHPGTPLIPMGQYSLEKGRLIPVEE